jgi:type I restriction enzyme, R subunit
MILNKKQLTETDITTKYITPALVKAGWDIQTQMLQEYYFTSGEIIVSGKKSSRKEGKKADYILLYKPKIPLAIVEAKDNNHQVSDGMQQAIDYAEILDIPFVYTSNGDAFCFKNRLNGTEEILGLDQMHSPYTLWQIYKQHKNITPEQEDLILQEYYTGSQVNPPRYYQRIAINRTIDAVNKNQKRILLVMATGTGKTSTAFQIIYKLWKAKKAKRILFLADRTSLIQQTKNSDFKNFGDKMTVLKRKQFNKSYEIYLALYQGISGNDEERNIYKQFSPDFFDLIVVDECHRGSSKDDSAWREVLTYFSSATQVGLTATPKETKTISNSEYFGDPIYTYSLKQGIEDGFLAPYKVFKITTNVDLEGYRPDQGKTDIMGDLVEDKIYETTDFDRNLVIKERLEAVAKSITEFLSEFDPMAKTLVFCVNQAHAERMRQALVNLNAARVAINSKYIIKITSDDELGKAQIENFTNPESPYPVIVTTVGLLSTGVDTKTCKVIILDRNIQSMTVFKQIIGRGTRVEEDYEKTFFNILDYRKATNQFADPEFDGQAVKVKDLKEGESFEDEVEELNKEVLEATTVDKSGAEKLVSKLEIFFNPYIINKREVVIVDGIDVSIVFQREVHYTANGKAVTKSLKDYTKEIMLSKYQSLTNFLNLWKGDNRQNVILEELKKENIEIEDLMKLNDGEVDIFDTLCYIAFDAPITKREKRAQRCKARLEQIQKYNPKAKVILNQLIDKYSDNGIIEILTPEVLKLDPFKKLHSPIEVIEIFGGMEEYKSAVQELVNMIY